MVSVVLYFMLELDPSLYMEMVYCTASDTALQDKMMLSLLGEEEARDSKGGNTEEGKKISMFNIWVDRDGHHAYCVRQQTMWTMFGHWSKLFCCGFLLVL